MGARVYGMTEWRAWKKCPGWALTQERLHPQCWTSHCAGKAMIWGRRSERQCLPGPARLLPYCSGCCLPQWGLLSPALLSTSASAAFLELGWSCDSSPTELSFCPALAALLTTKCSGEGPQCPVTLNWRKQEHKPRLSGKGDSVYKEPSC